MMSVSSPIVTSIIVVDDEPQVLEAIADTLDDEFRVLIVDSPLVAIEMIAEEKDLAVIVSDQRMPGLSGYEFLAKAREISDATRILLTGYSDIEALVAAVNAGGIFGFHAKPWDATKLRQLVRQAAGHCALRRALSVEQRLLHSLMNNIPDAIYFKDREHRLLRSNLAHARVLGIDDPARAIGRKFEELLPLGRAEALNAEDEKVLRSGIAVTDTLFRLDDDFGGEAVWLSTTRAAIRDELDSIVGVVAIARDVSARRYAEEDLRAAHDQLQRGIEARDAEFAWLDQSLRESIERVQAQTAELAAARRAAAAAEAARKEILATVSRDFYAPLTAIVDAVDRLAGDTAIDAQTRRHLLEQQHAALGRMLTACTAMLASVMVEPTAND